MVTKKDGQTEPAQEAVLVADLSALCTRDGQKLSVDPASVATTVLKKLHDGITTCEIDLLTEQVAFALRIAHQHYETLAARIAVRRMHEKVKHSFFSSVRALYKEGKVSCKIYDFVAENYGRLKVDDERDYSIPYPVLKQLESCLFRVNGEIVERIQHLVMRTYICTCGFDVDLVVSEYSKRTSINIHSQRGHAMAFYADILYYSALVLIEGDIFFTLQIPVAFMKRVENGEDWPMFPPYENVNMHNLKELEDLKKYELKVNARELLDRICSLIILRGHIRVCFY